MTVGKLLILASHQSALVVHSDVINVRFFYCRPTLYYLLVCMATILIHNYAVLSCHMWVSQCKVQVEIFC